MRQQENDENFRTNTPQAPIADVKTGTPKTDQLEAGDGTLHGQKADQFGKRINVPPVVDRSQIDIKKAQRRQESVDREKALTGRLPEHETEAARAAQADQDALIRNNTDHAKAANLAPRTPEPARTPQPQGRNQPRGRG